MSNNRDLLKEAIADAKAVKETAIANAKAALEEAFTPHLKSMLAAKLEEMDKDEDIDEGYDKYEEDDVKEEISTELDEAKKEDKEEVKEAEEAEEAKKEEIDEEEINLDELLAELEEGEDKDEVKESEEIEKSEEVTEEEEVEAEESEDEEAEGEMEEEEVDLEDMTEDDLKSFIEDVIKDMVEAGELEGGEEMESEEEESEEEIDIEAEDEEEEIMEMDEVSWNEKNNPTRGASKQELDPKKVGKSTAAYAINEEKEEVEELRPGYAVGELNPENNDLLKAISFIGKQARKAGKSVADFIADIELGKMSDAIGEGEDLDEIEELKKELQEVNLLNAKLLYTNKIFKSKNLSEDKKVKVLKAFDKAATVKEAKVIFETLNEGISSKMTKPSINEVKGSASKATGIAPKAKQPIVENAAFARMQRLAGIIK
jgi:hypothetical protein